ncbi:uncharacterized protein METZ01_LOCUS457695, partial [marine metagenome]
MLDNWNLVDKYSLLSLDKWIEFDAEFIIIR